MESPPSGLIRLSSLSNTLETCREGIYRFFASKADTLQSVDIIGPGNCEGPDSSGSRGVTDTVHSGMGGRSFGSYELCFPSVTPLGHWDKGKVRAWSQIQGFQAKHLAVGLQTSKLLIKSLRGYSG